jgi:DNA-nicking Smr family endonuclease
LALWRRVAAEVRPIRRRRQAKSGEPTPLQKDAGTVLQSDGAPDRKPPIFATDQTPPATSKKPSSEATKLHHGVAPGLDRRTLVKLRRGLIPVDQKLDLHGCTYDEGRKTVERFLIRSEAAGRRCVLIITGRGLRREGSGVLRKAVPQWLNDPQNRQFVLGFSFATAAHGGDGALYVLLRRRRKSGEVPT